jgi:hypothetical protein
MRPAPFVSVVALQTKWEAQWRLPPRGKSFRDVRAVFALVPQTKKTPLESGAVA